MNEEDNLLQEYLKISKQKYIAVLKNLEETKDSTVEKKLTIHLIIPPNWNIILMLFASIFLNLFQYPLETWIFHHNLFASLDIEEARKDIDHLKENVADG